MDLALRVSSEMVNSIAGVKFERGLMGRRPQDTIQSALSTEEGQVQANWRWMALILLSKNCRKALH